MSEKALTRVVENGVATISFDLPGEKVNVLRGSVMEEMDGALKELEARNDVRCLVVESAKPGVFIAGADIHEIAAIRDAAEGSAMAARGQEILNRISDLPYPSVALIDGAALGGGLELALACTYRLVTDNPKTRLGLPETTLGIIPGFGGTYRLPRLIGLPRALEVILSGKSVTGPRAVSIGLAHACYPSAFLKDKARKFVAGLGAKPARGSRRRGFLESLPFGRALILRAARKAAEARSGRHYPAVTEALRVLRKTAHASRGKALALEHEAIGRLIVTPVAKNLIALYFAQERAKKPPTEEPRLVSEVRQAAVLGAGVMGGRIAWLFSRYDVPVVMKDIAWEAVQKGFATAHGIYAELRKRRRFDDREVNLKLHRISGAVDYAGLGSPEIVIEAVVENPAVKKKVLAEVEKRVSAETIIASNTSSLSITDLSGALKRPERFLGLHFFNPPNLMPLVEVIPGRLTDPAATRAAFQVALSLGKTPIVVQDCPGFLVNRLLLPYLNECVRVVEDGFDFVQLDRLAVDFGLPMGPFTLLDEIGLDVGREVARILEAAYGDRFQTPGVLGKLKERGDLLGKKSGKGFYVHNGKRRPNPEIRGLLAKGNRRTAALSAKLALQRPLLSMINEASRVLEEKIVASPWELDLALVLGTGFPPFRGGLLRYADSLGLPRILETLRAFEARYGARFAPAQSIQRLVAEKKGFYTSE